MNSSWDLDQCRRMNKYTFVRMNRYTFVEASNVVDVGKQQQLRYLEEFVVASFAAQNSK